MEELELPKSILQRLVKQSLPDGIMVQKDAKTALSRSAILFISFLTATANDISLAGKQKTIQPKHIFEALKTMGFTDFEESLQNSLESKSPIFKV